VLKGYGGLAVEWVTEQMEQLRSADLELALWT